jgi:hypothetical protein
VIKGTTENTRAVCKVRGFTLFLQVETSWRCGDGLFFEVPPLASDALLTTLHPLLEKSAADRCSLRNFLPRSSLFTVGKAQKPHGARSGLYGGCSNGVPPIHFFQAEHRLQFMRFLGFSIHEKGAPRQEISK